MLPGEPPVLMPKANGLRVPAGARILVKTGGGGGWGDPAERDSDDVLRDRRLGLAD